jgi:hypothetical protein
MRISRAIMPLNLCHAAGEEFEIETPARPTHCAVVTRGFASPAKGILRDL